MSTHVQTCKGLDQGIASDWKGIARIYSLLSDILVCKKRDICLTYSERRKSSYLVEKMRNVATAFEARLLPRFLKSASC